jgi:hypothetical protein
MTMLHIDLKYINMISHRWERFKRKDDYLFNFRCPICGDSSTKKNKARGYIYKKKNDMFFKCHNCDAGKTFGGLLKETDPMLHKQYLMERYQVGVTGPRANKEPEFNFTKPNFEHKNDDKLIDSLMDRVDKLAEACGDTHTHLAVDYVKLRKIPEDKWKRLYHIDDISKISQLAPKYKDRIKTTEPRLVIPFFDESGRMTGLTLRDYGNSSLRYIMVKIVEDYPTVFGLDVIHKARPVKIVEGPLDSLFLDNCLAAAGSAFNKINDLGIEDPIVIVDNEPRNEAICNILHNNIKQGHKVVIWPDIKEKDINDMVLSGLDVEDLISNNVFQNLEAELKFRNWRKC